MNSGSIMGRKDFLFYATKLALPIMVQNLISTLVTSADTIMLGYVSQTAMSASSLANQYTFVLFCFYYGLTASTSVLCSQYFGKGDRQTTEKILGLATKLTVVISMLFFSVSFFFPRLVMTIFTSNSEIIEIGIRYLKVISFSFFFMGFSQVYISAVRSVGKVVFPSITYVVSLLVNVFLNASFIFGLFGLPKLGVIGVALGTVIARITETVMCLIYSKVKPDMPFRIKYVFSRSGVLFHDFLKISLPTIANDAVWSLAAATFSAILGHIGNDMVAANAIAVMVVNIGAIACRGFANATTIIVSQELGRSNMEATKKYANRMILITLMISLIGCIIIVFIRPFMVHFYSDKITETALGYLRVIILMAAMRLVGEAINTCLICGCFRGGGDSRYGLYLDGFFMWAVSVPLMAAAAFIFRLPPVWVYFIMATDEFVKMPVAFIHYFRFGWMRNLTRDASELSV